MTIRLTASNNELRKKIEQACGVDLDLCYECGKCTGGCSTGHHFDFTPRKIIQMIRLGDFESVESRLLPRLMQADALSICVSCRLCLERCPSAIDTPKIIDYLREMAVNREITPKRPNVDVFNTIFLDEIARRGRVCELSLIARFKMKTRDLWSDLGTGVHLLFKGKLNPFAPRVKARSQIRKVVRGA